MKKIFCITGVTGQDGSYAAEILTYQGCIVYGLSRNKNQRPKNLVNILHLKNFTLLETNYSEESLERIIKTKGVTHIMNFCGQSFVSKSWELIEETIVSKALIVSRLINIIRKSKKEIRLINACSSEIFGESEYALNEDSNLSPCNPYGSAQLMAYTLTKSIRNYSKIWACSAILFPHESLRRDDNFLFMRLLKQVDNIFNKKSQHITIGNDFVVRDWGFAVDYVYYMILIILGDRPDDFCICTNEGNSVKDFSQAICSEYELNYDSHIKIDKLLSRSYEPNKVIGNNKKLLTHYKLSQPLKMKKVINKIIMNRKRLMQLGNKIDRVDDYLNDIQLGKLTKLIEK
tara:strand:- start:222 stop:1256 length:1035 start_codon:yes stop_codon:yes gene_type:complete